MAEPFSAVALERAADTLPCQSSQSRYGCRVSSKVNRVCGQARQLYQVFATAKTELTQRAVATCVVACSPAGRSAPRGGFASSFLAHVPAGLGLPHDVVCSCGFTLWCFDQPRSLCM